MNGALSMFRRLQVSVDSRDIFSIVNENDECKQQLQKRRLQLSIAAQQLLAAPSVCIVDTAANSDDIDMPIMNVSSGNYPLHDDLHRNLRNFDHLSHKTIGWSNNWLT